MIVEAAGRARDEHGPALTPTGTEGAAPPTHHLLPPRPAAPRRPARTGAPEGQPRAAKPVAQAMSTIAHELRTPLATLHASLELLAEYHTLSLEEVGQLVRRLQRGVAWLDCLSANLATWSAIETGQLALHLAPVPVDHWITLALELVQPLLERREQRVVVSCPTPAPVVYGDEDRLGQVLVNLLVNAGKYGKQGDAILLTVTVEGAWVRIRVTDHGAGVPTEEQERIFQREVRGAAARYSGESGHGIGLHVVKTVVEAHGGAVGVASTPGRGATFWFTLPTRVGAV